MAKLEITDLHVSVQTDAGPKQILKGVNLTINDGEVHAIMGRTVRASRRWPTPWPGIRSTPWIPARSPWTVGTCSR